MLRGGVVGGDVCFRLLVPRERCAGQAWQADTEGQCSGGCGVGGWGMLPASGVRLASNR